MFATDESLAFAPVGFANEEALQDHIEQHPNVLDVISRMNRQDASLFIIGREFSVQSGFVDFLATDVEASLYIIETKLTGNPELRRTVIGQVLEYASNLRDMSYEAFAAQCSDYLQMPFAQALADFYQGQSRDSEEVARSVGEYEALIRGNVKRGQFNIVVATDTINLDIQRLFNFIDEKTTDRLNFIVLEINRYEIDSRVFLHSNVAWAAKYIRSLYSRRVLREQDYVASLLPPTRELIRFVDRWCTDKELSKTPTTKGLSWKNDAGAGGSVHVAEDHIATNWSTIRVQDEAFEEFKKGTMRHAEEAGFELMGGKTGGFRARFDDLLQRDDAGGFLSLAHSVMKEANRLASVSSER